jgi:hypothetical protein
MRACDDTNAMFFAEAFKSCGYIYWITNDCVLQFIFRAYRANNNLAHMHLKFISLGKQKIRGIDLPLEIFGALPMERKVLAA